MIKYASFNAEKTALTPQTIRPRFSWGKVIKRYGRWLPVVSVFIALAAWQGAVTWGKLPSFILPAPGQVLDKFIQVLLDGTLLDNSLVTLSEVLSGLLVGSTIATFTGYWLARSRLLERTLSPYLVASQAVPVVAIAPLLVIWFGPGMLSKILICSLTVFFPVLVNTIVGLRAVPESLRDLMHSLKANRMQMLVYLQIPSALPVFLGGLRIGATLSIIGALVGEFVGSDQGLGFLINIGRGQYDTALVFVSIFTLIVMALSLYGLVILAEQLNLGWLRRPEH